MSDELPGICCMCGGSPEIVYARAVDVHGIEAICRTCYPDKNPPQIARLIQENAKLRDLLRWRKWPEESPSESGFYLIGKHGLDYTHARYFHAGCNDWDYMSKEFYWMPQIPLPKESE